MKSVPRINAAYWASLVMASIFGANAGDFVADVLGLGHLSGIPYLAACLAVVFVAERLSPRPSALYFWFAIIIIRASATNIGDVFHDLKIGFATSVPMTGVLLILAVAVWRLARPTDAAATGQVPVNGFYWVTMFIAGVFGTVAGDAASYGVALGNLGATVALGLPLAVLFWIGRKGLLSQLYYYWLTVAFVRSAGTAAGDWVAHKLLGLSGSSAAMGAVFLGLVVYFYAAVKGNARATA